MNVIIMKNIQTKDWKIHLKQIKNTKKLILLYFFYQTYINSC